VLMKMFLVYERYVFVYINNEKCETIDKTYVKSNQTRTSTIISLFIYTNT